MAHADEQFSIIIFNALQHLTQPSHQRAIVWGDDAGGGVAVAVGGGGGVAS